MRPLPDKSKAYTEHREHTAKCKWCQHDRAELLDMVREHGVVDLSRSNRTLYIVTLLVLLTYLFGILTGFVLCVEQYNTVHNSTVEPDNTTEIQPEFGREARATREKVQQLIEGSSNAQD